MASSSETLIVSATYDDSYRDWYDKLPSPKVRVSTAGGGHPSAAFIRAYWDHPFHDGYLFLQDSLEPLAEDVVAPFTREGAPVVAWGFFGLFFDDADQERKVRDQYPDVTPPVGIFGPIFYAKRKAMDALYDKHLFPRTPRNKMDAQGTERAWAFAFMAAGIPQVALGPCVSDGVSPVLFPADKTFRKHFGGRQ